MVFSLGITIIYVLLLWDFVFDHTVNKKPVDWMIMFAGSCIATSLIRWGWDYMI